MNFNLQLDLNNLSDKELAILKYIHDHTEQVVNSSIQKFAKEVNYSTTTVLRLCKKLGFQGFPEFKYYLKTVYHHSNSPEKTSFGMPTLNLDGIKSSLLTDIEGTAAFINTETLPLICKLLHSEAPIYLHSPGGLTDICVAYLERLLFISGRQKVYKLISTRMTKHMIQTLNEGSIFFFISNSGSFANTIKLAKEAKIHGMITVSISSIQNNDLSDLSTYSLRDFTKNRDNAGADVTSRICTFFVISSLIEYYNRSKPKGDVYDSSLLTNKS